MCADADGVNRFVLAGGSILSASSHGDNTSKSCGVMIAGSMDMSAHPDA
jgi:hypothetical protein